MEDYILALVLALVAFLTKTFQQSGSQLFLSIYSLIDNLKLL